MIRCDVCGRFISYYDLEMRRAINKLLTPDSEYTREQFEALCREHYENTERNI